MEGSKEPEENSNSCLPDVLCWADQYRPGIDGAP